MKLYPCESSSSCTIFIVLVAAGGWQAFNGAESIFAEMPPCHLPCLETYNSCIASGRNVDACRHGLSSCLQECYHLSPSPPPAPINRETIVGVWEAIPCQPLPILLMHMEINKD